MKVGRYYLKQRAPRHPHPHHYQIRRREAVCQSATSESIG